MIAAVEPAIGLSRSAALSPFALLVGSTLSTQRRICPMTVTGEPRRSRAVSGTPSNCRTRTPDQHFAVVIAHSNLECAARVTDSCVLAHTDRVVAHENR
ncbi:hypothetical protein ACTWPB_19220 [Nocardia sp. IBHARD005]|uniref:hypothetical protein n=1 Tax=Nocardia sp. IBHARD005 TaxID=3457765 RepID=UPI00405822BB